MHRREFLKLGAVASGSFLVGGLSLIHISAAFSPASLHTLTTPPARASCGHANAKIISGTKTNSPLPLSLIHI